MRRAIAVILGLAVFFGTAEAAETDAAKIQVQRNNEKGLMSVNIDGKEAFVYRFSSKEDLAHYWPVRSPSGVSMTVQHPKKYPHHRSFWFGDKVQLAGQSRPLTSYGAYYSKKGKPAATEYPDRVRHVKIEKMQLTGSQAVLKKTLVWEMDAKTPVLDETRDMRIVALGAGEYFLDITFTVTATYGDVHFVSDAVHYAWPYIRMNDTFSVAGGGTITNSQGKVNQKATNGQVATWVDYCNTVDGKTEGLAIFSHSDNPQPHKWLTRDYGCFGPRRVDARSGKKFTLAKGKSLKRRVGILVHNGDVKSGNVAQRYKQYIDGKL